MFWTCSRSCSIDGLERETDAGQLDVGRLRAERVGFAVELLAEEIEPAADGAAFVESARAAWRYARASRSSSSRTSPRATRTASSCASRSSRERGRGLHQRFEKRAQARPHRLGLGRRRRFGGARERGDLAEPLLQHLAQTRALPLRASARARRARAPRLCVAAASLASRSSRRLLRLASFEDAARERSPSALGGEALTLSCSSRTAARTSVSACRLMRTPPFPALRASASEALTLPRRRRWLSDARSCGSRPSYPGGSRKRISRPLPLTLFSSQAKTVSPCWPSAREKPVMLVRGTAPLIPAPRRRAPERHKRG